MTSLREIKAKLDAIAESQGKLLAAIDGLNAGIAGELGELRKAFTTWFVAFDKRMTSGSAVMQGYLDREKERAKPKRKKVRR